MVNVEVSSPSLLLGIGLIMSGVSLFAVRNSNRRISRDSDVIVSSLIIVTGGALIFQGWRLDPLMLLCQLMTCGVAGTFAYETFSLREKQGISETRPILQDPVDRKEREEDEFFYDLEDLDSSEVPGSELPEPRTSMGQYLSEENEDGNWTVIGGVEPPSPPSRKKPKTKNERRRKTDSLQIVEDWE